MGQQVVSYCFLKSCWLPMPKMGGFSQFFFLPWIYWFWFRAHPKCYFHDLSKFPKMKSKNPRWFSCVLKTALVTFMRKLLYSSYLSHHPVVFLCMLNISADAGNTRYTLLATPGAEVPQSLWSSSSSIQNVNLQFQASNCFLHKGKLALLRWQ